MPAVNLLGQPYAGKALIAGGQQAINLYAEANDKSAPVPISYYQFPGTELFGTPLLGEAQGRCCYRTSAEERCSWSFAWSGWCWW